VLLSGLSFSPKGQAMKLQRGRSGLTLVEIIVAMGILVIIITLVGYIFNEVGKAVDITDQQMSRDVGLQTLVKRFGNDLHCLDRDGFLCIMQGRPIVPLGQPFNGYTNPPALIFTISGRQVSNFDPTWVSNASLVSFVPLRETGRRISAGAAFQAFGRYAYLLTGNTTAPPPSVPADCLRDSLADIDANFPVNPITALTDFQAGLYTNYLATFFTNVRSVNIAPANPAAVNALWPYVVGGYDNLRIDYEFSFAGDPTWYTPLKAQAAGYGAAPGFLLYPAANPYLSIWTGRDKANWPRAIRITVTANDAETRQVGQPCEMVFDLP
jgi:hypothetical protein